MKKWLQHPNLLFENYDISDKKSFKQLDYNFIIHSASIANPIAYKNNEEEIIKSNIDGTINILHNINSDILEKYMYISSGEIYNIANTEEPIKIIDLCKDIINNQKENLKIIINNDTSYEQSPILANIPTSEKLISLGWKPKVDLYSGFDRSINFFRQ